MYSHACRPSSIAESGTCCRIAGNQAPAFERPVNTGSPGPYRTKSGQSNFTNDCGAEVFRGAIQPIQIELDRTPRVRRHQFGKVVRQLLLSELVEVAIEPRPDPADRTRVRFDRLRLQALELQMLQVQRIAALEILHLLCLHCIITSSFVIGQPFVSPSSEGRDRIVNPARRNRLLRVAASSNITF